MDIILGTQKWNYFNTLESINSNQTVEITIDSS